MARPRKPAAKSPVFSALHEESRAIGENNDCAVKAVAIVTGVPYARVHSIMARRGRVRSRGTAFDIIRGTLEELGFRVRKWSFLERHGMLESYPPSRRAGGRHSITTHHPERFRSSWTRVKLPTLMFSHGHVSAYVDGRVHDWAEGRAKRVWDLWEVTKVEKE